MLLKEIMEQYLKRVLIYKSRGTYDYYLKITRALYKAFKYLNYIYVEDLTKQSLDEIVIYYKTQTKKKNSQINADIGYLFTVLNYYEYSDRLSKFTKLPDDTTTFRPLSDALLKKFIRYLKSLDLNESNNLSWVLSMYLMLDTGVRMNELLNIKTKNIDFISNSIILDQTKNGKKRVVFFDVLSKNTLKIAAKKNKEYIIWNYNKDERMNRVAIFYFMNKVFRDVDSDSKIHAHRLRKTFATGLLKNGCPITTIQKLLGHSDIKMTMIYLEIDTAMIEKDYFTYYPYKEIKS